MWHRLLAQRVRRRASPAPTAPRRGAVRRGGPARTSRATRARLAAAVALLGARPYLRAGSVSVCLARDGTREWRMITRDEVDTPPALALAEAAGAARDDLRARAVPVRLALALRVTASRLPPRDAPIAARRLACRRRGVAIALDAADDRFVVARDQAGLATASALTVSARVTRDHHGAVKVSRGLPRPEWVAAAGLSPAPARLRVRGGEERKADHEGATDVRSRHWRRRGWR